MAAPPRPAATPRAVSPCCCTARPAIAACGSKQSAGLLEAEILPDEQIAVDMGRAAHRLARHSTRPRRGHQPRRCGARTARRTSLHQYRQPARDLFCRGCRGDRSGRIRSRARASPAVSRSAPISASRPIRDPSHLAAGLGTRRRDDTRLRQRGLRGTCRRPPPRAHRAPGRSRARWRHPRHSSGATMGT